MLNIYDFHKFPNSNISGDKINKIGFEKVSKNIDKQTKYVLKIPYAYNEAFKYVSSKNSKTKTLLIGSTYGFLPQIIEKYSYYELIEVINLKKNFDDLQQVDYSLSEKIHKINNTEKLFEKLKVYLNLMEKIELVKQNKKLIVNELKENKQIDKFSNIKDLKNLEYLIIAGYGEKTELIEYLLLNNWKLEKKFIQKNYRSTIKIFKNTNFKY